MIARSPTVFFFTPSLMNAIELETIFVQREALVTDLVERVRESVLTSSKHHALVIGTRGMGKTHLVSLVYHRIQAMADLQDQLLIAQLREEEWGITSFLKLLLRILRLIDLPNSKTQQKIEALYEMSPDIAEQTAINLLLEIIDKRTLFLITENLDSLLKGLGELGQQKFRAFLQNSGCCTILATATCLFNEIQSRMKPFYGFFRPIHLRELTAREAGYLLEKIASLKGKTNLVKFLQTPRGKLRVQALEHLVGGNPRIYAIFTEFVSPESLDNLVQPFMALLNVLTPYYQSQMQYLSAQQREIIEFLCDHRSPAIVKDIAKYCFITSQTTSSQLQDLRKKGYVKVEPIGRESFYSLQDPLMQIVLGIKHQQGESIRLTIDFLRVWYDIEKTIHIEKILDDLLTQDSSQWPSKISDLIDWFEPVAYLAIGLVRVCQRLNTPLVSKADAVIWHDTWHQLVQNRPEFKLSLRLLTTAIHYKQKPTDLRVWLELSLEERKILHQALGLSEN
jgi:DNA-binding transcriptional ArsR family regulator